MRTIVLMMLLAVMMALTASERPPNILVLLADDQGWGDLSSHGNPRLETPNLDRLGEESLRFSDFSVNPACAPTRASLLTGRHFHRNNVWGVHAGRTAIDLGVRLLPEFLQRAGYATAMIGKWHNGINGPYQPWERGFEQVWSKVKLYKHDEAIFSFNGIVHKRPGWARDAIGDIAIQYMQEHRDQPFFLYIPFATPHGPNGAPERFIDKYRAKGCGEQLASYYAMVDHLDLVIGRILTAVDQLGLRENTVVLYLSDNGPTRGGQTEAEFAERNPQGWAGAKGQVWENGVRSPLFIRWPEQIPVGACATPAHVTDLLPTICGLTGASITDLPYALDGRDLAPLLRGEAAPALEERYLYNARIVPSWPGKSDPWDSHLADRTQVVYADQEATVRRGPFKLHKQASDYALYNLAADPGEGQDISAMEPAIAADLRQRLDGWFRPIIADQRLFRKFPQCIGWRGARTAVIKLKATVDCSPGITTWLSAKGLNQVGDFVRLPVEVLTPGRYAVLLHGTTYPGATWQLDLGPWSLTSAASGQGDIPLGAVTIDETGRFQCELRLVTLPADGPAMKDLWHLQFDRLD